MGKGTKKHIDPEKVEKMLAEGNTMQEVAEKIDCSDQTIYNRSKIDNSLMCSITEGYRKQIKAVERGYFLRIIGYDVKETITKYVYNYDEDGKMRKIPVEEIVKTHHIPGDTRAAEFYLKKRAPERWGDVPTITAESGGVVLLPAIDEIGGDIVADTLETSN